MEFIVELTSFLRVVLACFIAIFAYEIIKYSVDCNASFIRMLFNPRLYFLSFIYKESRNLTLNGKSPKEIQEIILEKFRTKTLPFLLYPQVKQKNIDAIHFAIIVLPDPGEPDIKILCPPAAAISRAFLAFCCPFTSLKSKE